MSGEPAGSGGVEAAASRAGAILGSVPSWVWDGDSLPVPVEDIVDTCFGLLVREEDDLAAVPGAPELEPGQSLSGLLLADRGEIWVCAGEAGQWPPRKRFTISHELGHWELHREGSADRLFCRQGSVEPPDGERPPLPPAEEEANAFAAELLMPAPMVRAEYERLRGRPDCFQRMCARFGASGAAMGRRLHAVVPRSS